MKWLQFNALDVFGQNEFEWYNWMKILWNDFCLMLWMLLDNVFMKWFWHNDLDVVGQNEFERFNWDKVTVTETFNVSAGTSMPRLNVQSVNSKNLRTSMIP